MQYSFKVLKRRNMTFDNNYCEPKMTTGHKTKTH